MTVVDVAKYDKGDVVRCSGIFRDRVGNTVSPTAVLFTSKNPNNVTVTLTYGVDAALMKDTDGTATGLAGSYYVDVNADTVGLWHWRLYSTGTGKASQEWKFLVSDTVF